MPLRWYLYRGCVCLTLLAFAPALRGDCKAGLTASVKKDYATALKEFMASAAKNDACSQYQLGVMYESAQGVPQDFKETAKWYRLAAEQGYAEAQYGLGLMYADNEGVPRDYKEALKWFRLAADQANAEAQYAVGTFYNEG